MQPASVVDLFCGIGGLSHGFVKERFNVVAGIDDDETCRYAYQKNNGARFIKKDIESEVTADEIVKLYPKGHTRILVGCAPCQPFSRYTIREGEDEKWKLLRSFAKLIKGVQPEIVSMENVPELEKHPVYDEFVDALKEDYHVEAYTVYCPEYGIPQTRERLVLFASKYAKIELVKPTHTPERYRTVRHAIGCLEPIAAGQTSAKDPLHTARRLSELNLRRIRSSTPGGSWKDWDEDLRLDCHKAETGKTYPSVYGRMKWDEPSPTMTTHCGGLGNGRFGHPEQDRAISMREAALFQTFPKSYRLIEPGVKVANKTLSRHIGNAVPVRLGVVIARSIKRHLEANDVHQT